MYIEIIQRFTCICICAAHNIGINERETRKKGKAEHRIRLKKAKEYKKN